MTLTRHLPLFAALLLNLIPCLAQSPQATVAGTVTDPQGAVIAGAEVTATNTQTGVRTPTRSNDSGYFALRFLPIGEYQVSVEREGFRRYEQKGIVLTTGQSLELNVRLEVGAVTESVSVSARATILQTMNSDMTQLVESKTIEDMPLGDRRSMNMINMVGAAVFVSYDSGAKPNFSLAGGRTQSQMLWIDGGTVQNTRLGIGQMDIDPPIEVLQEVKIISNGYAAEYGASAGGVVVSATKSGTNQFRGSLFEYLRNQKLDAANFFAPVSGKEKLKAPLRYNVFGGTVGGPVRLNRTFFFFGYEGARRRDGYTSTLTVPTEIQRAGDFSQTTDARGVLIPIYDPATTRQEGGRNVRTQFPGNRIPANRLDPVALKIVPLFPLPNKPPASAAGASNFSANGANAYTRNNFTVKIDHNLGDKDKFTGRYMYNSDNSVNRGVYPEPAVNPNNTNDYHQQIWFGSWTRIVSPTVVNEARFAWDVRYADTYSPSMGQGWPAKLGLKGVDDLAFPTIGTAGFANLGSGTHRRYSTPFEGQQWVDNISWVRGKHSMKFGAEARRSHIIDQLRNQVSGNFQFNTLPTGQPGVSASGNGLASLLLGFPTSFSSNDTPALERSSWYLAAFAQDDWAVSRSLTLNVGVRWETDTPIVDADNRMNGFDMEQINPVSKTPGVVKFAGLEGWRTKPYDTDWNNFGPRFGFAWKAFGRESTVVRGGYGIFFGHPFDHGAPTSASLGFAVTAALNSPDNGITAPFYLRNGVPVSGKPATLNDSFGAVAVGQPTTTAVTFFETKRGTSYSQQFNFGIQQELTAGMALDISYLGNLTRKLPGPNLPINQIRPERMGPAATQRDRPFPQFSNVSIVFPTMGVSSYHAGVVRLERRFSAGFNLLSTYTWAKFLNNTDDGGSTVGNEGNTYSNYYDRRADWGPSENDVRHRFTISSVYEVPFGKGRRFLQQNPLRYVAGGWALGTVAVIQSGAPLTATTQTNTTNAFSAGALRADVLRSPNLPRGERTISRWFDTSAFQQPAPYRFGNQAVGLVRADGRNTFNFSILRNFAIGESRKAQFRAELFNAFNHVKFGNPGMALGGAGFGVISTAVAGRQVQLGLRFSF
ncbi:MAG: carboxypeptidase regulatory-like domain-containing protein [Bryobacteraceae bacterium]